MSDSTNITAPNPVDEKATAAAEKVNAKASEGTVSTHEDALAAGYFGTVMSRVPNEVHRAGSESLRAELYGAAPAPETAEAKNGPFASMAAAKAAMPVSNDLATVATHPTLRGAVVNTADADKAARKDAK